MILDSRQLRKMSFEQQIAARRRVFLDGVEFDQVWYVDTVRGYLRTFNVLGDSRPHSVVELVQDGKMDSDWDDIDGVASKTLMGKITLKEYDEK
jgi:hypothetical protein